MEVGGKAVTTAYSGVASDTGAEMTLAYDGGGAEGGWLWDGRLSFETIQKVNFILTVSLSTLNRKISHR